MIGMKRDKRTTTPNEHIEITITGLGSSGEGVGKVKGFTYFIPGALPGERVTAAVTAKKKNYGLGRLEKILVPSPDRITPPCPVYEACGGCQIQHLAYEAQLVQKRQTVIDALERIGHFSGINVNPTLGADDPWHYRNKMQVPVAEGKKHSLSIGCFAQGTHHVIDVKRCLIQHDANNELTAVVRAWMERYHIPALKEDARTGIVRHIMGRVGVQTGEVMAVLVTNTDRVPHLKELTHMLKEAIPGFVTLVQNVNTRHTNVIMGPHNKVIYGPGVIHDRLGDLTFVISPIPSSKSIRCRRSAFMKLPFPMPPWKERKTLSTFTAAQGRLPFFSPKRHGTPWESRLSHQRLLTPEKMPGTITSKTVNSSVLMRLKSCPFL